MIRIFAQNFDNEKKEKQNILQVTQWFPEYNKTLSLQIGVGLPRNEISISESIKTDFAPAPACQWHQGRVLRLQSLLFSYLAMLSCL